MVLGSFPLCEPANELLPTATFEDEHAAAAKRSEPAAASATPTRPSLCFRDIGTSVAFC